MNHEDFLRRFGHFVDAPNGFQKVRELILQLAVQGKLIQQDPEDESLVSLLTKIGAEKKTLIAQGKIKKKKPLPEVSGSEAPFSIPGNWKWVRLGNVLTKITDGTHHSPINGPSGDFKYVSAKNIKPHGVEDRNITYVTAEAHNEIFSRCDPAPGDVLYIKDGATTGVVTINNLREPFSMLSSVALLKTPGGILNKYLLLTLRSPFFYDEMRAGMTGVAITRVTLKKLDYAYVPLPPLAEQHRIVAKVDELMALCDQLETERNARNETHTRLIRAVHHPLTEASDTASTATAWRRIRDNFAGLYTTKESVQALRQTVLQLAVHGQLVPQDNMEEPANILLQTIWEEKRQIAEQRKKEIKINATPQSITHEPFTVPRGWEWCRMVDVAANDDRSITDGPFGRNLKTEHYVDDPGFRVIRLGNIGDTRFIASKKAYIKRERFELLSKHHVAAGDVVVASLGDPPGRACLIPHGIGHALVKADCFRVRCHERVSEKYIMYLCNSLFLRSRFGALNRGNTRQRITLSHLRLALVPLPPFAEQHRIVAKVDELMALCDQLEAAITSRDDTASRYAEAVVQKLSAA